MNKSTEEPEANQVLVPTETNAIRLRLQHTGETSYPENLVEDRGTYWYLPNPSPIIGSAGIIISKANSKITALGSGCPPPAAFWAYENGILDEPCDLVITAIMDLENTIDCLTKTPATQRITPRPMKRDGWRAQLNSLPTTIFKNTSLHNYVHELKEIFDNCYAEFKVIPSGDAQIENHGERDITPHT